MCEKLSSHDVNEIALGTQIESFNNYIVDNVEIILKDFENEDYRPIYDTNIVNSASWQYWHWNVTFGGFWLYDRPTHDIGAMYSVRAIWIAGISWNTSDLIDEDYIDGDPEGDYREDENEFGEI